MKDFERNGILADDPSRLWAEMADHMREDARRLAPLIRDWLSKLEDERDAEGRSKKIE